MSAVTISQNQHNSTQQKNSLGLHIDRVSLEVKDGDRQRRILDDVSLHAAPGEIVGITGPSGSGKSTLLAVAGSLQEPTRGGAHLLTGNSDSSRRVELTGLNARESAKVRRNHIGIVFQQPNLLPSLNVNDQLMAMVHLGSPWPIGRAAKKQAQQRASELLAAVGLEGYEKRKINGLSGGQQARVNLARALMNSPELLLVDEPTAALDTETADQVTELIRKMAHKYNAATLYVSHDLDQLATLDRTITLVDGKIEK